jgi:hypothetical protein
MPRKLITLGFIFAIISLLAWSQSSGSFSLSGNKDMVQDSIKNRLIISHTEIFGKLQRPQVIFDHGRHTEALKKEGCKTCHPLAPGEDYLFDFPFKADNKTAKKIEDLYHNKCINCHRKVIREKGKSLPIRCGDCHIKRFESLALPYPHVEFDFAVHDKHVKKLKEEKMKDECSVCHHTYDIREEDESLRLVYERGTEDSCYYCHDLGQKRGPELSAITAVAAKKGLSMQKASHLQCVNCHLRRIDTGAKAGPIECLKCHTGKYRTIAELAKVPRPERDQPKKPFIFIEKANMKGVLFDHTFHENNTKTCRSCHHETLEACRKCHGMVGSPEGGWINLANIYHDPSTDIGCTGCHKEKKTEKNCAGCHYHLVDMDIQAKGPKKEICTVCHSGKKNGSVPARPIGLSDLSRKKVPEKVTIKILEKQYEPSTFPHLKIVRKLIEVSNGSKAGTSFHRNLQTICRGCHHRSTDEAEVKETEPPYCRNCHSITFDEKNMNRPRLLAVYHRQCMGCHARMGIKAMGCTDCHKQKVLQPKNLLSGTDGITTLYKGGA